MNLKNIAISDINRNLVINDFLEIYANDNNSYRQKIDIEQPFIFHKGDYNYIDIEKNIRLYKSPINPLNEDGYIQHHDTLNIIFNKDISRK